MTKLTILCTALLFIAQVGCVGPRSEKRDTGTSVARIGIYDSRAIAVAFVGSKVYQATAGKKLAEMMADYKTAGAAGDQKRMEELKATGAAQQALLHRQGFSTAPVDNILAHIKGQLPAIRKKANVSTLVSKWDKKVLAKHQSAERIDVTMDLIEAFKPNEKQKKRAIEIQKRDPVPLEKLGGS
ncbi:MAG: hypothetical protein PVJ98_06945 [Akkermansiaceae bacterium]|jgi:hypothetical protein